MSERKLLPRKFKYYTLKEIVPTGYLKEQLKIQAAGLSGNLQKFWPDIQDSKWIGGSCEGWERVPYWLDGFIPLAYLLDDEDLKKDAKRYVDSILQRQKADGWICPCKDDERGHYDVWAVFLLLKVLTVWHDATGDDRVYNAIYSALKNLNSHINSHVLFGWAQMRWYEGLISVYWLAERCDEEWVLQLSDKLKCQGFDYHTFFKNWPYAGLVKDKDWSQMNHVVNNASFYSLADIKLNGVSVIAECGKFCTVEIQSKSEIVLSLKSEIKVVNRPREMVAIVKGGMVYSMKIDSEWVRVNEDIKGREFPHCDYEVRPKEDWNYAIVSDAFVFKNKPLIGSPFDPNNAPNKIRVKMKKIGWGTDKGSCLPVPDGDPYGEITEREFIPYCCTDLRLTETKFLKEKNNKFRG